MGWYCQADRLEYYSNSCLLELFFESVAVLLENQRTKTKSKVYNKKVLLLLELEIHTIMDNLLKLTVNLN